MGAIFQILKVAFALATTLVLSISAFLSDFTSDEIAFEQKSKEKPVYIPISDPISSALNETLNKKAKTGEGKAGEDSTVSTEQSLAPEKAIQKNPISPPPPPKTTQTISSNTNEKARSAVINLFCEIHTEKTIQSITGSGVIIDPRGVILTNAHIAQYLLLKNYPKENATTCTVRTGNPARDTFKATLLYIPTLWIQEHAREINTQDPTGTGERDYALLYITDDITKGVPRPSSFSYIQPNTGEEVVVEGEPVLVTSYPAIVPESISIKESLYLVSSTPKVSRLFTFGENYLDLFSVSGNISAQRGSSGGAVVNNENELVGLIVTSTDDAFVLNRTLNAITLAHINRNLLKDTGVSLEQFLYGDLSLRSKTYGLTTAPILSKILVEALQNER